MYDKNEAIVRESVQFIYETFTEFLIFLRVW